MEKPPRERRLSLGSNYLLFRIAFVVENNTAWRIVLLLFVGLARTHSFITPLSGLIDVFLAGLIIAAFQRGLLTIHQVHVGHGVVVGGTNIKRLLQILHTLSHNRRILFGKLFASVLRHFGIAVAGVLHADIGQRLDSVFVSHTPVNHADGVGRFRVLWIHGKHLLLPLLGFVELVDLEIESGDTLETADVLGIFFKHRRSE